MLSAEWAVIVATQDTPTEWAVIAEWAVIVQSINELEGQPVNSALVAQAPVAAREDLENVMH